MMFVNLFILFLGMASSLSTNRLHRHVRSSFYTHKIHSHGRMLSSLFDVRALSMATSNNNSGDPNINSTDDSKEQTSPPSQAEMDVLQLAQSHFAAQALLATMRLGVLDVLEVDDGTEETSSTVDEIITKTNHLETQHATTINRDALFRCLRLLCTTGVIKETTKGANDARESAFLLTEMGQLLQKLPESDSGTSSMAPFILHWSELSLWDSWSQLPDYVAGKCNNHDSNAAEDDTPHSPLDSNLPPFDRANGMTASDYYKSNAASCSHRNAVARHASSKEITSILDAMQFSSILNLAGKTVVDIGGGYGDLMDAVKTTMPTVGECYCLDLPDVIADAISTTNNNDQERVATLIPGDMFDPTTIPKCDLIVTKHVLCDFSDEDVISALQSFQKALSKGGKVVIMDAVLPNGNDLNGKWNAAVSFDVLLMLTGRRGERSRLEWSNLADKAGLVLSDVLSTSSVTVDLAILSSA